MKLGIATAALGLILALSALIASGFWHDGPAAQQSPLPPARFWGTILVNGVAPALGSVVSAKVDNRLCGQSTVREIAGVGVGFSVDVLSSSQESGCGDASDTVVFAWAAAGQGSPAVACAPTGIWDNTRFNQLNLTCGEGPSVAPIELVQGFNLILYNGPNKGLPEALTNIGSVVRAVFWWDAQMQAWFWFFPGAGSGTNNLTRLANGQIYWVITSAAATWQLGP